MRCRVEARGTPRERSDWHSVAGAIPLTISRRGRRPRRRLRVRRRPRRGIVQPVSVAGSGSCASRSSRFGCRHGGRSLLERFGTWLPAIANVRSRRAEVDCLFSARSSRSRRAPGSQPDRPLGRPLPQRSVLALVVRTAILRKRRQACARQGASRRSRSQVNASVGRHRNRTPRVLACSLFYGQPQIDDWRPMNSDSTNERTTACYEQADADAFNALFHHLEFMLGQYEALARQSRDVVLLFVVFFVLTASIVGYVNNSLMIPLLIAPAIASAIHHYLIFGLPTKVKMLRGGELALLDDRVKRFNRVAAQNKLRQVRCGNGTVESIYRLYGEVYESTRAPKKDWPRRPPKPFLQ